MRPQVHFDDLHILACVVIRAASSALIFVVLCPACSSRTPTDGHTCVDQATGRGRGAPISRSAVRLRGSLEELRPYRHRLRGRHHGCARPPARVKARMVQYNYPNLVPSLERGDFDVVMNGLEGDGPIARNGCCSDPYFVYAEETLAVRSDSSADRSSAPGASRRDAQSDIRLRHPADDAVGRDGRVRGQRGAVSRSRAEAHRRGAARRQHHRRSLRLHRRIRGSSACRRMSRAARTWSCAAAVPRSHLRSTALRGMRTDGELERILRKAKLWDDRQHVATSIAATEQRGRTFDLDMLVQFLWAAVVTLKLSVLAFLLAVPVGMLLAITASTAGACLPGSRRVWRIELFEGHPGAAAAVRLFLASRRTSTSARSRPRCSGSASTTRRTRPRCIAARCSRFRGQTGGRERSACGPQILRHVLCRSVARPAPDDENDFVSRCSRTPRSSSVITMIELTKRMTSPRSTCAAGWYRSRVCSALSPRAELSRRARGIEGGCRVISVPPLYKRHGKLAWCCGHRRGDEGARRSRSSGRRAAASRRCCAASSYLDQLRHGRGPRDRRHRARSAWAAATAESAGAAQGLVGMVFQQFNLFPHLTALEHHARAAQWSASWRQPRRRSGRRSCSRVGLGDRGGSYPRSSCRVASSSGSRSARALASW